MKEGIVMSNYPKIRWKKVSSGQRGSAIIMALVTMTILLLLGLAVAMVSTGTLNSSAADASNNNAYYAAKSAVTSAIEQLKYETSSYYAEMLTANSSDYPSLYADFFATINENARSHFMYSEPHFDSVTTNTTFTQGAFNSTDSICEFLVSSTATAADGNKYKVNGKLYVKKVDVSVAPDVWLEVDDVALKVGGTLTNSSGFSVNGGNILTSNFVNPRETPHYLGYNIQDGYRTDVIPGTDATINDCLEYSGVSYSNPVMASPNYTITVNNSTLESGTINSTYPSQTVSITSAPGISFTLSDTGPSIYPGSVVYSKGNLTLTAPAASPGIKCYCDGNFSSSGADKYVTVYCAGDANITSGFYGTVYCKGKVNVTGNFHGAVYCNGDFTMPSGSFEGLVVCGGNSNITATGGLNASYYAAGNISINSGVTGVNHVVYAGGNITLTGGNNSTVLFAGGDISVGNTTVNGAIIAKGSVTQTGWFTVNYSRSDIEAIMNSAKNEFFFPNKSSKPELNEDVFMGQSITPIGNQS